VTVIKASNCKVRVRFGEKLKFFGKSEPDRDNLEEAVIKAGKWL